MKIFRKVLCMILAVVMIAGITPRVEAQAANAPNVTQTEVEAKISKLRSIFNCDSGTKGYFTSDRKAASTSGSDNCYIQNVIKSSWLTNAIGMSGLSTSNMPLAYKPNGYRIDNDSCYSCMAFATFAEWYIFAGASSHKVTVSKLSNGKMAKSTFTDSRIGDVVVLQDSLNEVDGHAAIILGYDDSGIKVLDCNWPLSGYGHCVVQVHKISYGTYVYATVSRATNYSAHVHDYSGDKNIGYCNSCKNDYLTTSAFNSSKVYTSGRVTPKTTTQLHVKMRPYAASTWTNGDANIKADRATMEYTCKNHWGNTWYCVKFKDSSGNYKTGYVYNEDVNFVKDPNTVSASCFLASRFGGKINEGDSLWISKSEYGGSVKSTDGTTKLAKVVFGIYNTNGSLTSSKNEVTKTNINATSYSITSSDDTILFSSLSQGNYVFKITGYDVDGKSGSASFNFTVVKSGTTTYTVSYNANGGSGEPSSQTKIKDTTLTLSTQKPTRDGFAFIGWATSPSATSAQYQPGGSYTSNASVTLYAVWEKQIYTISYNANGGTGAPAAQTKAFGYALALSTQVPTRSGYAFLGWATSSSATSAQYQPGDIYSTNANLTLYAVWKTQTYTVSYNANGGSGAPSAQTKTHDVAFTLSTQKPTRDGYTFLGWATSSSAAYAQYQPGDSYTNNANVTLYAVWQDEIYTITYYSNGGVMCLRGVGGAYTDDYNTESKGKSTVIGKNIYTITRDGYTFMGWATNPNATVAQYQNGDIYNKDVDIDLYALWSKNASGNSPVIEVKGTTGMAGEEVSVTINLKNNPGISSMKLNVQYDSSILEPVSANIASGFKNASGANAIENISKNPIVLNWVLLGSGDINENTFATITFKIKDNAPKLKRGNIIVTYDADDVCNSKDENVPFEISNGYVEVVSYIPGDINGDGKVNNKDVTRLFQYLSGMDVEVVNNALDVNGDGKVNNKDVTRLFQYLSGMDVEIH